ncbi:glutathione S-transferase [Bartonella apis]|uniref:glutathione S-transferase n=1 Tax=Bartonella apis TaxID=1686310 RepID=UPI001CED7D2A|nr:glutathione S-transferase [Bartonella apis]
MHIANKNYSSWSLRPWVLMKTLGIEFEEIKHYFKQDNYSQFKVFSPSARVPVLIDGTITVWDSLAITEYLYESYHNVRPTNRVARAWARSAAAEMHSSFQALRAQCPMSVGVIAKLKKLTPELENDIRRVDELFVSAQEKFNGPFLAGDRFTAVDAFFCPVAFRIKNYNLKLSRKSMGYIEQLIALSSMQEWLQLALEEQEMDPMEEQELDRYAIRIKDLREI